ncbi:telomere length regulation protein-domain-containing protein [Dendryphion nanum]|uniref:Telomere length regulation protein-domain-containing protein n=1 Tax=Dendryphion nanum TaxID=256645 RepID=A0A9P9DN90_9PLEO|nr:telomere length regulation protein-domain-containing protein [Dendryphion nanum]
MDDFLTPVATTVKRSTASKPLIEETSTKDQALTNKQPKSWSPDGVSEALKNKPDLATLGDILKYLASSNETKGFNLVAPGPVSAQIADTLVSTTIPDYWQTLKQYKSHSNRLIECLRNPNGIGAVSSRLRSVTNDSRASKANTDIEDLLDVLAQILADDSTSSKILKDTQTYAANSIQQKLMWKEYIAQVSSGRILGLTGAAEDVLKKVEPTRKSSWLAIGHDYAQWLGGNMAVMLQDHFKDGMPSDAVAEFYGKALGLGYTDHIVSSILRNLLKGESTTNLEVLLSKLKAHEQRKYLNSMISFITSTYFSSTVQIKDDTPLRKSDKISGASRLVHNLIKRNEILQDHIVDSLTQSPLKALEDSIEARRSVIAAIAQEEEKLHNILERSLKLFGDKFYILHTPIIQQEALAQTLMITCGYVQRSQPMFLTMMAKSSYHVGGMSNRVGATSPRARFIGMAGGMVISRLVDKKELQLKFEMEGDEAIEAKWYHQLAHVDDKLGDLKDLEIREREAVVKSHKPHPKPPKATPNPSKVTGITEISGPRIVEILDESSDEDNDLLAYEKPDSDPEDDADDPTEINRNKPTAPVYIRDLIVGLRDQENYERHELALATAASLIRRKANFGTEVIDHIEELASILLGLNDNLDISGFNDQRQQALIAILLTKPAAMAQYFARSFFSGDYSLAQRISMLTTLGLGARELAGLKDPSTDSLIPDAPSFPSKTLPSHLQKIYSSDPNPVSRITHNLTKQILSPIAATAADQLTGPDILKVRTFSTRMAVEARRSKPIPNALAQIVADNFFFPLTGRWWITIRSSNSDSVYTSTHLLPPFLQTLSLLLNAAGPNTLALPQMTREFWDLLLSVRGVAGKDKSVLKGLLFAFLMLLETNQDSERVATEQAKELLETQEWVRIVFEQLGAGSEEDESVRVLAAGVLVRCQEVVDKYQRRMVGAMMNY